MWWFRTRSEGHDRVFELSGPPTGSSANTSRPTRRFARESRSGAPSRPRLPRASCDEVRPGFSLSRTAAPTRPFVSHERKMHAQHLLRSAILRETGRAAWTGASATRSLPVAKAAPHDDRHAERVRTLRHLLTDVAVSRADRACAERPRALEYSLLFHAPGASPRRCRTRVDRSRAATRTRARRAMALAGQFDT